MIKDSMSNFMLYSAVNENFKKAYEWYVNNKSKLPENGKYTVDEDIFVIVQQKYKTNEPDLFKWETHKDYIDVQILLRGKEKFGVGSANKMKKITVYDEQKDVIFYMVHGDCDFITLTDDEFIIVFPWEAHLPACVNSKTVLEDRLVFKVKMKES